MVRLSFREFEDISASPHLIDELVSRNDATPVLIVDVGGCEFGEAAGSVLTTVPMVTVGVAESAVTTAGVGLARFDVLLTEQIQGAIRSWVQCPDGNDSAVEVLAGRIDANPLASVALVQLLRLSSGLGVVDAITAESFTYSMLQSGPEFGAWLTARRPLTETVVNPVPLRVERDGESLLLTFCRPEIRNAFGFEVRDALVEALQLAAADDTIRSVVLRGDGPSFCSGGDLREFGTTVDPVTAHRIRTTRSAGIWLHRVRDRLRAEIHGDCIGSGIELPAFAGRVTAAEDLRVRLPEIAMGLVPGAGGTASLPRRIGRQRTNHLALSGETLDAPTALAWGLVDELA